MTSLGYILTNWTTEFIKHKKDKKRKTVFRTTCSAVQTDGICSDCTLKSQEISSFKSKLNELSTEKSNLSQKLEIIQSQTLKSEERRQELLLEHETVQNDLKSIQESLNFQLEQRDQAHSERMKLLEQVMNDKNCEWAKRNERLQRDLRRALRSSIRDTDREQTSIKNLEQEIESLLVVVDMRTNEIHDLRDSNNQLNSRLERHSWLETELGKAKQRIEEMGHIIQGKIDGERELLSMMDSLTAELKECRSETNLYRRELENRQYLTDQPHPNSHQKARSSGGDPALVFDVVEKMDSVAWMVQMPTSNTEKGLKIK